MLDSKTALNFFSVLGDRSKTFTNQKFDFYLVPGWETPSFSPLVLLPNQILRGSDLKYIEEFFLSLPMTNHSIKPFPYFNIFNQPDLYNLNRIEDTCLKHGWELDPSPLVINVRDKPIPVKIFDDFHYRISNFGDKPLHDDLHELIKMNFNADENYLKHFEKAFTAKGLRSFTVIIYNFDNLPVAANIISLRNNLGFLTWGSTREGFRNKGFVKSMQSISYMLALSHSISICALTSRNKFITKRGDQFFELYIFRKTSVTRKRRIEPIEGFS